MGDLEAALTSLRDNLAHLTQAQREDRAALDQRIRDLELEIGGLRGVRQTLFGPDGTGGIVREVQESRQAANARRRGAEGLLWPFLVAAASTLLTLALTRLIP